MTKSLFFVLGICTYFTLLANDPQKRSTKEMLKQNTAVWTSQEKTRGNKYRKKKNNKPTDTKTYLTRPANIKYQTIKLDDEYDEQCDRCNCM